MRLPKFGLRDLFWLVLVVAVGLGWLRTLHVLDGMIIANQSLLASRESSERELAEMKAIEKAYSDRLSEFGNFSLEQTGPLEFQVVAADQPQR
jgi:hypothetical protein